MGEAKGDSGIGLGRQGDETGYGKGKVRLRGQARGKVFSVAVGF